MFEDTLTEQRLGFMEGVSDVYGGKPIGMWLPPERRAACTQAMWQNGFYELVGRDSALVTMLAGLSIAGTMHLRTTDVAKWMPFLPMPAGVGLERLLACEQEHGFPLVVDRDVMIASYV